MLRERLKQRLLRREQQAMNEMVALYQDSIQHLQEQLQVAERDVQEMQSRLQMAQNQSREINVEIKALRQENTRIQNDMDQLSIAIPVEIYLPTILCRDERCTQVSYRDGVCFEHYCKRALQGGPLL